MRPVFVRINEQYFLILGDHQAIGWSHLEIFDCFTKTLSTFATLSINPKNLRALSHGYCLFLLESIPHKHKLQIYKFNMAFQTLEHLYLGSLQNLAAVGIYRDRLFRIYISPDSNKLSLNPSSVAAAQYQTNKEDVDFIVKFNKISKTRKLTVSNRVEFQIDSDFPFKGSSNPENFFLGHPNQKNRLSPNSLFCKGLSKSGFSFANAPVNLELVFFDPFRLRLQKSIFDKRWNFIRFFRQKKCFRLLGVESNMLHLKKWNFPCLSSNILDCIVMREQGTAHKNPRGPKCSLCISSSSRGLPWLQ